MPSKGDLIRYVQRKDLPQGWLARTDAEILQAVMDAQRAAGLAGSAVEIGVHHGRSMIAICLGLVDNEKAYAIDIFDQQHLNKDGSGRGNRDIFEKNLAKFGVAPSTIVIDPRPSDEVKPQDILEAVGPARIFSVDGGHWTSIVQSDLRLAEASIAPHGVIALDDFHRLEWPEVSAGYFAWFGERTKPVVPFAMGYNKLYLCQQQQVAFYQQALAASRYLKLYRAKEVEFQDVRMPVYHRMLFPDMDLRTRLTHYLMIFHPDYYTRGEV